MKDAVNSAVFELLTFPYQAPKESRAPGRYVPRSTGRGRSGASYDRCSTLLLVADFVLVFDGVPQRSGHGLQSTLFVLIARSVFGRKKGNGTVLSGFALFRDF